jgi:O-antigen/teichoic acid export membrane protein
MKALITVLAFALALPALLLAIALGPVIVGVLCAVGFGLIVFAIGSLIVGLVTGIEHAGSRLARHH